MFTLLINQQVGYVQLEVNINKIHKDEGLIMIVVHKVRYIDGIVDDSKSCCVPVSKSWGLNTVCSVLTQFFFIFI